MERGEVRWYTFKQPDKRRPVLLLTRSSAIQVLHNVTIAPITTTVRHIPSELFLSPADGMTTECAANFDNIQTISKANLGSLITILSPDQMAQADQAIAFALGMDAFLSVE
jgi:mRNA interferase MazF